MSDFVKNSENQILRGYVLYICNLTGGASYQLLRASLKKVGVDATEKQIEAASNYLQGKKLVTIRNAGNKQAGITRSIVYITPEGIDVLEGTREEDGIELMDNDG